MRSIVWAFVLVLAASGCATVMAGGPDHVQVASNPPGATVTLNGMPVGRTPMMVTLDRHLNGLIGIEAPGYAPVVVGRNKDINGWLWVNICVTGALGMLVDWATGDYNKFDETPIFVNLVPGGGPPPPGYGPPPPNYPAPQGPPPPGYGPPSGPSGQAPPPGY